MVYNTSFMDNSSSLVVYYVGLNSVGDGLLTLVILFTIFLIMMISMKDYDTKTVMLVSSFVTMLLSLMFMFGGFIDWTRVIIFVVMVIGSVLIFASTR